VIFFSAEKTKL